MTPPGSAWPSAPDLGLLSCLSTGSRSVQSATGPALEPSGYTAEGSLVYHLSHLARGTVQPLAGAPACTALGSDGAAEGILCAGGIVTSGPQQRLFADRPSGRWGARSSGPPFCFGLADVLRCISNTSRLRLARFPQPISVEAAPGTPNPPQGPTPSRPPWSPAHTPQPGGALGLGLKNPSQCRPNTKLEPHSSAHQTAAVPDHPTIAAEVMPRSSTKSPGWTTSGRFSSMSMLASATYDNEDTNAHRGRTHQGRVPELRTLVAIEGGRDCQNERSGRNGRHAPPAHER